MRPREDFPSECFVSDWTFYSSITKVATKNWSTHVSLSHSHRCIQSTVKHLRWSVLLLLLTLNYFCKMLHHWPGVTCTNICYMCKSVCRWLIVENAKIFRLYLKISDFSYEKEIVESWLVYANKFSWIISSCSLTKTIKQI